MFSDVGYHLNHSGKLVLPLAIKHEILLLNKYVILLEDNLKREAVNSFTATYEYIIMYIEDLS